MNKRLKLILMSLIIMLVSSFTALAENEMPRDEWQPSSITLSETSLSLVKNQPKFTLTASVFPEYASQDVKWESSNTKIVTVSSKGVLSAKKVGSATITCTSTKNSNIRSTCYVTVTDPVRPIEDIEVKKEEYQVVIGKRVKLQYEIKPSNASNKYIKWEIEDKKICSVDDSGNVYGKEEGDTVIRGTSDDGGFEMEFYISVSESNDMTYEDFEEKYPGLEVRRQNGVNEGVWIELTTGEYLFYDNYNGEFTKGWFEADGKTYYAEDYTFELITDSENGYWNEDDEWIQSYTSYTLPVMKVGWLKLPSAWTYLKSDGAAARNEWVWEGKQWYYLDKDGYMKTGLFAVAGVFYVADANGACQVGFVNADGKTFYCDPNTCNVKIGWIQIGDDWYYGDDRTGALYKNTYVAATQSGYWYYLKEDGRMLTNGSTPEGHTANAEGLLRK